MPTLKITNLHASVEGKKILKGINLEINDNELVSFECFIYNGNNVCANATINAYLPKNATEFIEEM